MPTPPTVQPPARDASDDHTRERRRRYRRGHASEWLAAAALIFKGYRIVSRRHRSAVGEIDIIAKRGRRLAFVEVKARATIELCEASLTGEQRQRIRRAADRWLAKHPELQDCDLAFDLVFVVPRRWPIHIENGL